MSYYRDKLVNNGHLFDFPIHKPYHELEITEKELIWNGNEHFIGLNDFFNELESKSYKVQNRVMLSRYRGKTKCNSCNGKRLRKRSKLCKN